MRGCGLIAGMIVYACSAAIAAAAPPEVIHLAEHATALVRVMKDGQPKAYGSAFCIDEKGLFITNAHVADGKSEVDLVIDSGQDAQRIVPAKVIRADAGLDLAELQAQGDGPYKSLTLGKIDGLVETQDIIAFGYPFGAAMALDHHGFPAISVNIGHITSLRRKGGELELIQVDALVNPGNSGGPVIDSDGKVVGIIEAGIPGAGVNFAIPISRLDKLLNRPAGKFDPSAPPVMEGVKQPVPAPADQQKAEKTIDNDYQAELARPRQADRIALAKTLIDAACQLSNSAAERYMMLIKARDLAAGAGDLESADAACWELSKNFDISLATARLAMLQDAAPTLVGEEENASFVVMALHTVDDALMAEDFPPIKDVLKLATVALRNAGSGDLGAALLVRKDQFALQQRQYTMVQPQIKTLADHPDDPAANLAVGKYDCFIRGDWDTGLPLLAKGSDAHLKQIAQADMSDPEQPDAQAAIADDWFNLSSFTAIPGDQVRLRAYFWYLKAEPGLDGPAARHVAEHIDELQSVASRRWGRADTWLAVRKSLRSKSYQDSRIVGGAFSKDTFEEVPACGGILIGLRIGRDEFVNNPTVGFFQGIYLTPSGEMLGRPVGILKGDPIILKAKPGYAVGAITAHGGGGMDSFIVTFMKIDGKHLDPHAAYTSDKVGGNGGGEAVFDGRGMPIIGLCGKTDTPCKYPGFGVVYMAPVDPETPRERRSRATE